MEITNSNRIIIKVMMYSQSITITSFHGDESITAQRSVVMSLTFSAGNTSGYFILSHDLEICKHIIQKTSLFLIICA